MVGSIGHWHEPLDTVRNGIDVSIMTAENKLVCPNFVMSLSICFCSCTALNNAMMATAKPALLFFTASCFLAVHHHDLCWCQWCLEGWLWLHWWSLILDIVKWLSTSLLHALYAYLIMWEPLVANLINKKCLPVVCVPNPFSIKHVEFSWICITEFHQFLRTEQLRKLGRLLLLPRPV